MKTQAPLNGLISWWILNTMALRARWDLLGKRRSQWACPWDYIAPLAPFHSWQPWWELFHLTLSARWINTSKTMTQTHTFSFKGPLSSVLSQRGEKWLIHKKKSSKGDIKGNRRDCTLCHCIAVFVLFCFFNFLWDGGFKLFPLWSLHLTVRPLHALGFHMS